MWYNTVMKKLIVGNWKMNPKTKEKARALFSAIDKKVTKDKSPRVQVVMCPPAIYLNLFSPKKSFLGAQDVFSEVEGARTGQISPAMLSGALGDTNEIVAQKIKSALSFGLTPILCIGEHNRDEEGKYLKFLKEQLTVSLSLISKNAMPKVVIAYEPVWAIGKSAVRDATPEESEEMAIFIKKVLSDLCGPSHKNVRILYGGSVTMNNAESFLVRGGVNGLLVGRESLNPKNFLEIISTAHTI